MVGQVVVAGLERGRLRVEPMLERVEWIYRFQTTAPPLRSPFLLGVAAISLEPILYLFDNAMSCAVCNDPILNHQSFFELTCGRHSAHSIHDTIDCSICNGKPVYDPVRGAVVSDKNRDSEATLHRKANQARRLGEPLNPRAIVMANQSGVARFIGAVLSGIAHVKSAASGESPSAIYDRDPFAILKAKESLKDVMVARCGYDITELINDHGVTINDFFAHGYTMSQLCEAFHTRMNKESGLDVLSNLGLQAEHFRACPAQTQIGAIQHYLGYEPRRDLVDRFGYRYYENDAWTIPQLVGVGLTMQDLVDTGLTLKSQWEKLVDTATSPEQVVKEFKATAALLDGLKVDPVPQQQQQQSQLAPPVQILPAFYQPGPVSVPPPPHQTLPTAYIPPVTVQQQQQQQSFYPPQQQRTTLWNTPEPAAPRMVVSSLVAQPQRAVPPVSQYDYHVFSSARAQPQTAAAASAPVAQTNNNNSGPRLKSRKQPVGVLE